MAWDPEWSLCGWQVLGLKRFLSRRAFNWIAIQYMYGTFTDIYSTSFRSQVGNLECQVPRSGWIQSRSGQAQKTLWFVGFQCIEDLLMRIHEVLLSNQSFERFPEISGFVASEYTVFLGGHTHVMCIYSMYSERCMFVVHALCRYACMGKMFMNPSCSGPCWTFPFASTLAA